MRIKPKERSTSSGTRRRALRRPVPTEVIFGERKDHRWWGIAAVLTISIHAALILSLPDELISAGDGEERTRAFESFDLVLDPIEEPDPAMLRYVEANPEVETNVPDETDQFSFRDQQAADESDLPVTDRQPDTGGEEDSQAIVETLPSPQIDPIQEVIITPPSESAEQPETEVVESGVEGPEGADAGEAIPEVSVLPDPAARSDAFPFDEVPDVEEGASPVVGEEPQPGKTEGEGDEQGPIPLTQPEDGVEVESRGGEGTARGRPSPRPRPQLPPETVSAPVRASTGSVPRHGTIAVDANFSAFGEYQQQMMAAVQRAWYQEIEFFRPLDTASRVHVRFVLQSDGVIRDAEVIESTAGEVATFICVRAIEDRSPLRPWTEEMVNVFGEEKTIIFVFRYL